MAREASVNVTSERNPRARDPEKRVQPFASVLLVALIVVPLFCLLLRAFIAFGGDGIKWLIVWLILFLFGTGLPLAAIGIGYRVTKRVPFVIWHVALTLLAFATAVSLSVLPGWDHVSAGHHWWDDAWAGLLNIFSVPLWMTVVYTIASLAVAGSWLLYRIDAFRAATGDKDSDDSSSLAALVKWPKGARIRKDTIEADEFAVTAEVDHAGVPVKQLRSSLEAIEEQPGIIRGRASIVGGDRGGRSTVRLVHTDPHTIWRPWPGLTHPGGLYHEPISTSYYSTGEKQWYSFVRTPDGYRSSVAPKFRSPNGTFKGSQGMTSSGKSGDAAIELAEVFSRRDVQVIYIDVAKLLQNAGWCLDFVALAAANRRASADLFAGLRRLGEYRTRVLGEANIRDFSHEAVRITGLSWLHIFADEFDVASQGANMTWLATKGRSLGMRFSFTLPRAHGGALDTDIRGAVGMWCQFGISQDYDKGFALSDETIAAGANPEQFGTDVPGAHYLDGAPGVDKRLYSLDCRTYQTREDYGDLRRAVEAARATFTPMTFTLGEIEALGPVYEACKPSVVRAGHLGQDDAPTDDPTPTVEVSSTAAPAALTKGKPMDLLRKFDTDDLKLDPATQAMLDDLPDTDVSDLEAEFGNLDPRQPMPDGEPDRFTLGDGTKPKVTKAEGIAEMKAALVRMADRGVRQFESADVRDEMRVAMRAGDVSEYFTSITRPEGDQELNPPGLVIERLGRGKFMLTRLGGQ
jgi:hypothetical protein